MPTFVSTHTFCASRKAWLNRHARAMVGIDVINYASKYSTKMKAKSSYFDQIKFNGPVLKSGILVTYNGFQLKYSLLCFENHFYDNCRNFCALIGHFSLSISGETHEFQLKN